jgi:Na+/proline symporter
MVGLGHGKEVKNIKDYALGGRNFSTTALVATIVATFASGSGFMVTLSRTYSDGLEHLLGALGTGIALIIIALFLVPRMGEFLGNTSLAEAMGDLYGKKVRFITAIAAGIGATGTIAAQFKVFGAMFSFFFYLPAYVAIIAAGAITTAYSAFGGIRAVTFTDMLQFIAFGFIIPLLGFLIWNQFYYSDFTLMAAFAEPKFNLNAFFSFDNPNLWGL